MLALSSPKRHCRQDSDLKTFQTRITVSKGFSVSLRFRQDVHAGGEEPTLARAGWLTKLSKGGFMANWNRRFFALVGSTLYYGASPAELCIEPKLFVRLDDVANLSYATTCDARAPR